MSQDNQITLRGFVTAEPRLWQTTPTATPVTEIRVGSTLRRLNRETGEWQDAQTSYYTVKCWRRLAINAASSLHKGDMVVVRGRFYTRTWVDNLERPRTAIEVEADSVGHDLSYGWSHFLRGTSQSRSGPGDAGETARQERDPGETSENDDDYTAGSEWAESAAATMPTPEGQASDQVMAGQFPGRQDSRAYLPGNQDSRAHFPGDPDSVDRASGSQNSGDHDSQDPADAGDSGLPGPGGEPGGELVTSGLTGGLGLRETAEAPF